VSDDIYTAVDTYLDELFGYSDPTLEAALHRSGEAGLPPINVSSNLGRLLHVLALARGARTILEIGTLGGFSAIWLARALPGDGRLISLEQEPKHAEVARENVRAAGLADRVEIRVGRAIDLLAKMESEDLEPFDMVFIDADKEPYTEYLRAAIRLSRPGALIVADNVVRGGKVLDPGEDQAAAGIARFNAALAASPDLMAAVVQTVGVKGHDGMALAVVRESP
jgi:caffeoyl-CoA O-methyltransferase